MKDEMAGGSRMAKTLAGFCLAAAAACSPLQAGAAEKLKMSLDWAFQGPQSIFTYAADQGYFASEGIDITIDRGAGSTDAVNRVGSGAYDVAIGDINSMMEYNLKATQGALVAVMMIYDRVPICIITLDKDIKSPKDLIGKKVVTSAGAADYKLFPLFARGTGIDASKVEFLNVQPQLREAMLVRGEVAASTGFYHTSYMSLKALGVDAGRIKAFMYYDYGSMIYGNAIITSRKLAEQKPELVKGLNRAIARAMRELSQNPELAMPSLQKRDATLNAAAETERLKVFLDFAVKTPWVRENGFGDVDRARMEKAIDQVSEALGFSKKPGVSEVFSNAYLPPKAQRMLQN